MGRAGAHEGGVVRYDYVSVLGQIQVLGYVPSGLVDALSVFRWIINEIFANALDNVMAYMDVVVFSSSWEEHIQNWEITYTSREEK